MRPPLLCRVTAVLLAFASPAYGQRLVAEDPLVSHGALRALEPEPFANLEGEAEPGTIPVDQPSASAPVAPGSDFPGLSATIDGLTFDINRALSGSFVIPPDPNGAAGRQHLVAVNNVVIEWFDKNGGLQERKTLRSFFLPLTPLTLTFDPKVVYDAYLDRFVVVTLERTFPTQQNPASPTTSRVLLAVSDDGDPNGVWYFHAIDAVEMLPVPQTPPNPPVPGPHWADFPGFAVDEEAVYITANMFSFAGNRFGGVRLWIVPKASFYAGAGAVATRYNPIPVGSVATTSMPTMMLTPGPGATGTFLVSYSGLTNGNFAQQIDRDEFLQVIRVDNPLAAPTFTGQFIALGDIEFSIVGLPGAPQLGGPRLIATNDRRVSQSPVWRGNHLWLAAPTLAESGDDANQVTARWWRLNTTNLAAIAVADTGAIGGEEIAPGTFTYFPTVAVDNAGDMAVGFAASGPGIHAGAYATGRLADDPPGTTRAPTAVRFGEDYYVRAFNANPLATSTSRWGDYSGLTIDPFDGSTFWVHNEWALPRGTIIASIGPHEQGRWATGFGSFAFACTFAPTSNITVGNDPGVCGATVGYGLPSFSGGCGALSSAPVSGSQFLVGTTNVTVTGTRVDTSTRSTGFVVTVEDREPPSVSGGTASPAVLWPPNHRMVDVFIDYALSDNCAGTCSLEVTSNEAADGRGDGHTDPDWEVVDPHHVRLRAERSGGGSGRVYTVRITCADAAGNTTTKWVTVGVAHDSSR